MLASGFTTDYAGGRKRGRAARSSYVYTQPTVDINLHVKGINYSNFVPRARRNAGSTGVNNYV